MAEKKRELETKYGKGSITDHGDKLVVEISKPADLSLEELDKRETKSLMFCDGCAGITSGLAHVLD